MTKTILKRNTNYLILFLIPVLFYLLHGDFLFDNSKKINTRFRK